MYAEIFSNASFPDALLQLDREFAREAKLRGCPRCEAVLDVANYSRKPRSGPLPLREEHGRRLSLCCRREGCRLLVGADRRTLERWRCWWVERVGSSREFEIGRADFMPAPDAAQLPRSLVESFVGATSERVLHALRWLARQFGSRFPTVGGSHAELAR